MLRAVTHWTQKDVQQEKRLTSKERKPSCILETTLSEILHQFEWCGFIDKSQSRMALASDLWKKTVDVQQHFNDLELRIRNYAVTILAAIVGLAAYAMKENLQIAIFGHGISVAAGIFLGGIVPWVAFYFMDRFWYHRLLYGAVAHGKLIEDRWKGTVPEFTLTDSIGKHSPLRLFRWEMHSPRKIDCFYWAGTFLLLGLCLLAQFAVRPAVGVSPSNKPTQGTPQSSEEWGTQSPPKQPNVGTLNRSPRVTSSQRESYPRSNHSQKGEKAKQ